MLPSISIDDGVCRHRSLVAFAKVLDHFNRIERFDGIGTAIGRPNGTKLALERRCARSDGVKLALEWRFGRQDGVKLALERRCGWPNGVKLALERRFGRQDGAKLALERRLGRPGGAKLALEWRFGRIWQSRWPWNAVLSPWNGVSERRSRRNPKALERRFVRKFYV